MAVNAKQKARARRLCEYDGWADERIEETLGISRRSITNWKAVDAKKKDPWVKGRFSQELREKERVTVLAEAEKAGITIARHLKELAIIGYSDMADYVDVDQDTGATCARGWDEMNLRSPGASRVVKKIREKRTIRQTQGDSGDILVDQTFEFELHDKPAILREITDILGMKKADQESERTNDNLLTLIRSMRPK